MWGAASPPHAVPNGRCASPPRRLPSTPLLTGLPPRFFRHWRRSAPPPRPAFEKSGGKPAGKLLLISNGICWPAAHRERRACFVCRKLVRKNGRFVRRDGRTPQGSRGGRRGRCAPTKQGAGGLWPPPPCFGFAGPSGPQNAAVPPPRTPASPPPPPRQHTAAGHMAGRPRGAGRKGRPRGGGGWALRALKERGPGPEAPAPLFCLAARGPKGPRAAKRRRPPRA